MSVPWGIAVVRGEHSTVTPPRHYPLIMPPRPVDAIPGVVRACGAGAGLFWSVHFVLRYIAVIVVLVVCYQTKKYITVWHGVT